MQLTSALPVAMMFFRHWHIDDSEAGIVIVKAAFRRHVDGTFRALPPPDWVLEDRFAGDPAWTPLVQEQDIAPGKDGCDLTVAAVARAPGGHLRRDWPVSVLIADRLAYGFHVRGPSMWQRQEGRWRLAAPAPVAEVPLSYALAWGGAAPGPDDGHPEVAEVNPAGQGLATPRRLRADDPFPAPQIGDLADFMSADPAQTRMVHGLQPIAKAWLPRRALAGTFDQAWRDLRHPRMPFDHALRFWNAAPRPLQIAGGLVGNEMIRLGGVSATFPDLPCPLPAVRLWLVPDAGDPMALLLDTVQIDVTDPDPLAHGMTLLWRVRLPQPGAVTLAEIHSEDLEPLP